MILSLDNKIFETLLPRPGEGFCCLRGWKLRNLSNKFVFIHNSLFSLILDDGYQHLVVYTTQTYAPSERCTSASQEELQAAICTQSWPCPTISLPTLWEVFYVEVCNNSMVFPSICVEEFELFQDTATQILIGLLHASFANNYFFIVGFIQFQFVIELVEEHCGHNLRITDDGGNHPRN